jgi:hypothetical protein
VGSIELEFFLYWVLTGAAKFKKELIKGYMAVEGYMAVADN